MDNDDKWNTAANRIDAAIAELRRIADALDRLRANYEADKARQYEQAMRLDLQAPYRFLANQQPRVDGDHRPWESRNKKTPPVS